MATVNTVSRMLVGAQLIGERYTEGTFRVLITDGRDFERARVTVSLVPGYSSRDHLFDRTLAAAAAYLAERDCFATADAAGRAVHKALAGLDNGRPRIEVEMTGDRPVKGEISKNALAVARRIDAISTSKRQRRLARRDLEKLNRMRPVQQGDGWVISYGPDAQFGVRGSDVETSLMQKFACEADAAAAQEKLMASLRERA